ncbi:MAG: outer membrane protein assembly factor [bacterium]|nr:outer membrane protein assembly factor [bacterium]
MVVAGLLLCACVTAARAGVEVELKGLDGPLKANALAALSIGRAGDEASAARVQRLHARAPDEIRLALQPFGRYAPVIRAELTRKGDEGSGDWLARYEVDPGPQVMVASVDVQVLGEGAADPGFREAVAAYPLLPGAPLDHAAHEAGKRALTAHAARKGYFDAAFDSSAVLVHVGQQRADIVVRYDSGRRYRFGPVRLKQDILDDRRVIGYVRIREGEPYDVEPLLKMQNELSTGPYFAAVEVRTRNEEAEGLDVPIDVDLTPAPTQRWEVGGGYGTDTGARAKVKATWRRLNRAGHHAEAEIEASQVEYSATGKYFVPWPYPRTELLTVLAGIGRYEPRWAESWRLIGGVTLGRARGGWRETLSLAYEREDFTVAGVDGASDLVLPGLSWTRTNADDPLVPTHGARLRLDLAGAHESVLSSVSFLQAGAEAKVIRSLSPRVRVIARGALAHIVTDDVDALPPTHRFVTGGDQSVRGYAYESLGPVNANAEITGGDTLAWASLELEFRFLASLGLAVFTDAGNAWRDGFGDLAVGPGAGLRWFSPIGIVRLDGAAGLSEDGDPLRIHLAIGPDL